MTRRVALVLLVVGVTLVALALWAYGTEAIGSYCNNGDLSDSTGQGTCSRNDGIDRSRGDNGERTVDTVLGLRIFSWIGVTKWPALLVGAVGAAIGLVGLGATSMHAMRSPTTGAAPSPKPIDEIDVTAETGFFAGDYLELMVVIDKKPKGFAVEVTTPMGYSRRALRSEPLPADRGVQQLRELTANASRWGGRAKNQSKAIEAFGTNLFEAILTSACHQAYRDSIDFVRKHNAVLRIVLQVDDRLADIPWEYLYDPERGAFLSRSHETSLVRLLPVADGTRSHSDIATLRVLSMAASPRGTAPLDIADEQQRIRSALAPGADAHQVELEFVDGGTFQALHDALHAFKPHVFHFAGHGEWDTNADDGAIVFEDHARLPQPRTGKDLGVLLNQSGLRLAIFNSCHGATPSKDDRFAGITSSLVAQGVPAAIGMQFVFDDKAAVTFSSTLLRELGAGAPLDQAVTAARIAVFSRHDGIEWGTPVLTTRTSLGDVIPRSYVGVTNARS